MINIILLLPTSHTIRKIIISFVDKVIKIVKNLDVISEKIQDRSLVCKLEYQDFIITQTNPKLPPLSLKSVIPSFPTDPSTTIHGIKITIIKK